MKTQDLHRRDRQTQDVEREAAFHLASLISREFYLTPQKTSAVFKAGRLRVVLTDALSPLARLIIRSPDGPCILQEVYAAIHDANRPHVHRLITRIVGHPVRQSKLEVDGCSGELAITFEFAAERE